MLLDLVAAAAAAAISAALPGKYRDAANWLCRPGHEDVCTPDPDRTVINADGTTRMEPIMVSPAPKADCFYVYPTASHDPTPNSDMLPGIEERGQAASQLAVFAGLCRTFAPVYRQVTLTALHAAMAQSAASGKGMLTSIKADWNLGYQDVKAAWDDYLAHDNQGRPFVLIGHSQGSLMLKRLLAEDIDGKPVAKKLVSAIIPGTTILVPKGKTVGGDFKELPLCRSDTETECIVVWASYRDAAPPPANALFGRSTNPMFEAGCTNPARLQGGSAPLDPIFGFPWWTNGVVQYKMPSAGWAIAGKAIPTRFARLPGLLSGACVSDGAFSYLSIHVTPNGGGDLGSSLTAPATVGDAAYPEWGWHVLDIPAVQGDLVRLTSRQIDAWANKSKSATSP